MRLEIPEAFATTTIAREGEPGREWLAELPTRFDDLCRRWGLIPDGPAMHGYLALVVPVIRDTESYVLKISWMDAYTAHEIDALRAWEGRGAVQLIASDRSLGALLLERLDAHRTLESLSPDAAIEVAGGLLRRLAIPAPSWANTLADEAAALRETLPALWQSTGRPFSRSVLDKALGLLADLSAPQSNLLVNHDLHYENVLAGTREPWLVIDPKVVAGDLEFAVAQLLWQPFTAVHSKQILERRLAILVEAASLDNERARAWAFVRLAEYWLWALDAGLTEDPLRCQRLLAWL